MIRGYFDASRLEGIIRLDTAGPRNRQVLEAIVDTGFTGFLTLPSAVIAELSLPWTGRAEGMLGDGSVHVFDTYDATVDWDGHSRTIEIAQAETQPLIGMSLLKGYELKIQAVEGGLVTIGTFRPA